MAEDADIRRANALEVLARVLDASPHFDPLVDGNALADALGEDERLRELYVRLCRLDVLLEEALGPVVGVDSASFHALASAEFERSADDASDWRSDTFVFPAINPEPPADQPPVPPALPSPRQGYRVSHRWVAAASVGLIVCGVIAFLISGRDRAGKVLRLSLDARWSDQTPSLLVGSTIRAGSTIHLDAGLAELQLASGVHLILEAPVELALPPGNRAVLNHGRIVARVPRSAIGFHVTASHLTVTDLGTEFGMTVREMGAVEISVFQGRVQVSPPADAGENTGPPIVLSASQAMRCSTLRGEWERFRASSASYVRDMQAPAVVSDAPSPLAVYSAALAEGSTLPDLGRPPAADGTFAGLVTPVRDVPALSFDGQTGFVDLGNPSKLNFDGPITMAAWIKLNSTYGYQDVIGHGYSLSPKAEVFLRIRDGIYEAGSWNGVPSPGSRPVSGGFDHVAAAPVPSEDYGAWVHLAAVYDGECWRLFHNGALLNEKHDPFGSMRVQDSWRIGNGSDQASSRFFRGQIREVKLYAAALKASQIQELAADEPIPGTTRK